MVKNKPLWLKEMLKLRSEVEQDNILAIIKDIYDESQRKSKKVLEEHQYDEDKRF